MTCQNCGALVRLDRERGLLICDYCGSECTPLADEDGVQVTGETARPCAVCHAPLSTGRIEARDVLYCTACHGILVSMDDFGFLLEDLREHRSRAGALLTPDAGADSAQDLGWAPKIALKELVDEMVEYDCRRNRVSKVVQASTS
jgi:hypothetical protein